METKLETQMSFGNDSLFQPSMTVNAMRDSRYRHPALAVAELIDNSIDAQASRVEILIREEKALVKQRNRWKVAELAVFDNGHGMSADTLLQALRFGGREPSQSVRCIGKYGVGLPTASVSQCKRVDIWTWEHNIKQSLHSYIDIDEIEAGAQDKVPQPQLSQIPEQWLRRASPDMLHPGRDTSHTSALHPSVLSNGTDTFHSGRGTLVVWSKLDRLSALPVTIFNQVEEQVGRIYRRYIDDSSLTIRMASFRSEEPQPQIDRTVRPNDPTYLMRNSSTPAPWDAYPMFRLYTQKDYTLNVNGREEAVEVVYSIVKQEPLGEHKGEYPGNREYGRHAKKNMGISVVREDREILLEHFFITEDGGGGLPQNRWWGCEVRFGSGCDDLFGVDHNKQMVSCFSTAIKDIDDSGRSHRQQTLDDLGAGEADIHRIVSDIRGTIRNMMREIKRMFASRPGKSAKTDVRGKKRSIEATAISMATDATRSSIERRYIKPTQTDRDRTELDIKERENQLAKHLTYQGLSKTEAQNRASLIIQSDDWYSISPTQLSGSQMFSFASSGGVLNMSLNIEHPIYEFLKVIETEATESDNHVVTKTAIGILAMLLSWGRMEDDIEASEVRREVQDHAMLWGRMVSDVLRDLNTDSA